MKWFRSVETYLAVLVITTMTALICIRLNISDISEIIFPLIVLVVCFPVIIVGLYMWITGRGKKLFFGMDWSQIPEDETERTISYLGFWLMICGIIFMIGMSLLFVNLWASVIIVFVSLAIYVIRAFKPIFRTIEKPLPRMSTIGAFITIMLVASMSVVPTTYLLIDGEHSTEHVTVTFFDDNFSVRGPLYYYVFSYDDVEGAILKGGMEIGVHKSGYDGRLIYSGSFYSNELGNYSMTAFKSVDHYVVYKVHGNTYVFNQDSVENTTKAYDELSSRIR